MNSKYLEYIRTLRTNYRLAIKVEWLNEDETTMFELTNDLYDMSGSISTTLQNGTRTTGTIKLNNINDRFPINPNGIWFNQKVRISLGLYLGDGTPFYIPKGVFYIKNPQEAYLPGEKSLTLDLVDKWSHLDGTLFGYLDGIYQTPLGSNIYDAISALLKLDRGNGKPLDVKAPLLSSYYLSKKWTSSGMSYDAIKIPYTSRIDIGGSYADVLLDYAKMLACHIYYNENGQLVVEPTNEDVLDETKPVQWEFSTSDTEFMGENTTFNIQNVYNEVQVLGAILNGYQAKGMTQNTNISSPTRIQLIGRKCDKPYVDEAYYADEQCQALAEYYLRNKTIMQKSVSITCAPIFHIGVNKLVSVQKGQIPQEKYLVSGYTLPIGQVGTMSIAATSLNELNLT